MKKYCIMFCGMTLCILLLLLLFEYTDTKTLKEKGGEISSGNLEDGLEEKSEKILVFCSPKDKGMVFQNFYQGLQAGNTKYQGNVDISVYEWKSIDTITQAEYEHRIAQAINPDYVLISSGDTSLLDAGIPYFLYDGDIENSDRLAYVGTENYQAGYLAGEEAEKLFPEEEVHAAVIMLSDKDVFIERAEGFRDFFEQSERLFMEDVYNISGNFSLCRRYVTDLLERGGTDNAVNVIFCEDSVVSGAVAELLQENEEYRNIKVIGMDLNDYTLPYLKNGCLQAVIDQDYYQAGLDLMNLIVHKEEYDFPITVYHDCKVITAEDLT